MIAVEPHPRDQLRPKGRVGDAIVELFVEFA